MPRPKRTKVAPSAPAPRVKKLTTSRPVAATSKASLNNLFDANETRETIMSSTRLPRKGNGKGKERARVSDEDDDAPARGTGPAASSSPARDTTAADTGLDLDLGLHSSSPEVEVGRREQRTPGMESSMLAIGNFRRRPRQPSILGRAATRHRSSSVELNTAETNGLTSVSKKNTSTLAPANFKSRPRQPSIMGSNNITQASGSAALGMGATPRVESALKLGNFKRRAREPSILRTAQKEQPRRPAIESDMEDEEDDFNPEDESTPLNLSRTRNATTSSAAASSGSRKRKLGPPSNVHSSPRLLSPAHGVEDEEPVPATYPTSEDEKDDEAPPEEEEEAAEEEEEEVMASIEAREETPPMSETLAPPMSSSSVEPSPMIVSRRQANARGRGASRAKTPQTGYNEDSDVGSPPSLTHSPNLPVVATVKSKPNKQAPPPSTFSTRQLQALLPRRRRRPNRDVFDLASSEDEVDASGLGSDDDELIHMNPRARRRPTNVFSRASRTPAPTTKKKVPKLKSAAKQTDGLTTYGRGKSSDKENEVDPNDSLAPLPDDEEGSENSQELEKRLGKELKMAARKFQEVDEWEMEFEDAGPSSSPKDAR